MDYTTVIESKMSKVEGSLEELNKEILIATKYLQKLKANSAEVVRNLNCIVTPSTYLEEFLNVNSFLLKSISFLAEFNCRFEIFGITEKTLSKGIFIDKSQPPVAKSKATEESEKHLKCHSAEELGFNKHCDILDGDVTKLQQEEVASDNHKHKGVSKNESTTEKLKVLTCKNNNKQKYKHATKVTNSKIKANASMNKCNNGNVSIKNKDNRSSHKAETIERNNASAINNSEDEIPVEKHNAKESDMEKKLITDLPRGSAESHNKKVSEVSNKNCCISAADDLTKKASSTHILGSTTQSSGAIPVAEVVPTKIIEKKSEDSEDFNHSQDAKDFIKPSQPIIENDNEVEEIEPADIARQPGKEYDVVVEYINSPSEFYVSIIEKETDFLKELEKKLKEIPASKNDSPNTRKELTKSVLSKEIGNYCLVYLKCDEMWFRAKVTNWCLNFNDEFVNVFLLDNGESKCVSINNLQAMPKYLKQYPAFTVRCHLHDVFPVDMHKISRSLSWGKEASEEMKSLTEDSQNIRMRVETNDSFHPEVSLPVTLWLVDQGNKCINELLVNSKFAVHGKSVFEETEEKTEIIDNNTEKIIEDFKKENIALNNWNPMKEDYESYKNSYDLDVNDPSAIIYGYVGKDYDRICRHYANTGYCYKGSACRKEHKKSDHLGFTTDQEEVFQSAISNLPVPPPKSKVNIQVTCLLSCNKFFCFMESQKSSPEEEDLHSLLQYMNNKENILEMKKLLIPPSAGQIVIARYSQDKAWYRARVLESQPENDQYTVLFVDYGNSESLHLSDIRAIEARYLHLPFQAVQCCIFGIKQNPEVPTAEVMDYMQKIIDNGHLSIEVIARLPGDNINLLVNIFDPKGVNIGQNLISKKYAVYKEEMIINSASESIPG